MDKVARVAGTSLEALEREILTFIYKNSFGKFRAGSL
jgi:hypothetical protein